MNMYVFMHNILISKFRKPSNFSKNEIKNCTIQNFYQLVARITVYMQFDFKL